MLFRSTLNSISERKIRFASILSVKDLIDRIEDTVTEMEFRVEKKNGKVSTITYVLLKLLLFPTNLQIN